MGYKEDIRIDTHSLDKECALHPSTHFQYGRKHADALHVRRLAELEEQEEMAAADERVRARMAPGEKTTETSIRRMVDADPNYQAARRAALDAAREVNVLAAAIESLNAKTRMLSNLVQMHLAHWQSEPALPREARDKRYERDSEEQHDGLQDMNKVPHKKSKLTPVRS